MVHEGMQINHTKIWLLNSGASNHMTTRKNLFHKIDESMMYTVKLGDDKEVDMMGEEN